MSLIKVAFLCFVFCVLEGNALKLPSYIIACSKSDPKLDECALAQAKDVIPKIIQGDPKYHIPKMNPLEVPAIEIGDPKTLHVNLKDSKVFGLENAVIKKIHLDLQNKKIEVQAAVPSVNLQGTYTIKGHILVLPINGNGACNITFANGLYTYNVDYEIVDRKGEEYIQLGTGKLDYETERAYFQLDNLFNGDARLGDQMNKLLNENWKEVARDIGPAVVEAVSTIINTIFNGIADNVPYKDIFKD